MPLVTVIIVFHSGFNFLTNQSVSLAREKGPYTKEKGIYESNHLYYMYLRNTALYAWKLL